ncbi:MAG: polysaccharide export protein [Candidatus Omnitrophica bacterium]|nr:polysaccharide export protein [Candidatus Omnitrophota bacterium]
MIKNSKKISAFLLLVTVFISCGTFHIFAADDDKGVTITIREAPVVFAPEGLKSQEQESLERDYSYQYRQKGIIGEPAVFTPFAEKPSIAPLSLEILTEQEKLYRYFGIASILYENGNLEEAKELLEYILYKRPNDEYIRNYLENVKRGIRNKSVRWRSKTRKDASRIRKAEIKENIKDGLAYYRQKRFNVALVKFADALSLDPKNAIAKRYLKKLKKYYLRELKAENIANSWQARRDAKEKAKNISRETSGTKYVKSLPSKVRKATEKILDRTELEQVVNDAKISYLMRDAELALKIDDVITQKRDEERKKHSYTLGPGDEVVISVQDHPELSGKSSIGPTGDIVLPLVNEPISANGLTSSELQKGITIALKRYVKDPVVYVGITEYRSKVFYVIDETGCTPYRITRANFTLRDALFMSDWGYNRALGRVIVTKPHLLHPITKKVDAFDIVYRGNLSNNIRIDDGDVIYIPMTAPSKITNVIADTLSPIKKLRDLRSEWIDWRWNVHDGWYNLFRMPRDNDAAATYAVPQDTEVH